MKLVPSPRRNDIKLPQYSTTHKPCVFGRSVFNVRPASHHRAKSRSWYSANRKWVNLLLPVHAADRWNLTALIWRSVAVHSTHSGWPRWRCS